MVGITCDWDIQIEQGDIWGKWWEIRRYCFGDGRAFGYRGGCKYTC